MTITLDKLKKKKEMIYLILWMTSCRGIISYLWIDLVYYSPFVPIWPWGWFTSMNFVT